MEAKDARQQPKPFRAPVVMKKTTYRKITRINTVLSKKEDANDKKIKKERNFGE